MAPTDWLRCAIFAPVQDIALDPRPEANETLVILHECETAVVVHKPPWLLVHSSAWAGPRERTLMDLVRDQLPANLHPVHRLDRQCSGVLLLARGGENARAWQSAMQSERSEKWYLALVRGGLREGRVVEHALRDEDGVAREARSEVRPICWAEGEARSSLVAVRIFTGRQHQVRRHLKHLSHPMLGDANYGKQPLNRWFREHYGLTRMALHAHALAATCDDGAQVRVRAAMPQDLAAVCDRLYPERWRDALREAFADTVFATMDG
ncbi:MAG: pseudouridine synthase [Deltaproteobacteria bacterium]|nr:pseudouridine synthase [Deltaproteobacteria bacterium]